ncbi:hypothetical protein M5K25_005964 [Dendrobium thyrsiflorum]|uniref:Uncharacterized protein n=1 Tax=Dendrobium thyrsiflorum TaxID=117978 RepID=A0ABD0VBP2_DENTH
MDLILKTPMKQMIQDSSRRLKESLALPIDDIHETKAKANEIFRCYMHYWNEDEDCILWHVHDEVMKVKLYMASDDLRDVGWRYLKQRFMEDSRHWVPLHFLKGRIREIGRNKEGCVEEIIESSMVDVDYCILYHM